MKFDNSVKNYEMHWLFHRIHADITRNLIYSDIFSVISDRLVYINLEKQKFNDNRGRNIRYKR